MALAILGKLENFQSFPAAIEVEQHSYYLLRSEAGEFKLVSRRCPHMGYTVEYQDGKVICDLHDWTFDARTGICNELPGECLKAYPVEVIDGVVTVIL